MRIALVLIAMILSANCTMDYKKYPVNLSGKRNLMKVFTEVEAKIKAGGPLDIIAKTLDDFTQAVIAEQSAHDALHERSTNECNGEFDFRSKEVADAVGALKQGQATLDGCVDQKARATSDLSFTRKVLAETQNFLRILTESRQHEAEDFLAKSESYEYNSAGINEAIDILEGVFSGESSLIELVRHAHKLLANSVQIGGAAKWAPAMSALAQVTFNGGADNELLEQIRNILNKLHGDFDEAFKELQELELKNQEAFDSVKARTSDQIEALTATQGNLEVELSQLNKCIVTQTGIVGSATAKRDRNQRLWDEAGNLCNTSEAEYTASTAQRREELDIIDALRS